mmetsp:Transcript_83575/g.253692  ORF Transcript_83575/g.253692 Transcript_83575/m.253692 type:complete len:184 (+) Transcript_83575:2-553(+)
MGMARPEEAEAAARRKAVSAGASTGDELEGVEPVASKFASEAASEACSDVPVEAPDGERGEVAGKLDAPFTFQHPTLRRHFAEVPVWHAGLPLGCARYMPTNFRHAKVVACTESASTRGRTATDVVGGRAAGRGAVPQEDMDQLCAAVASWIASPCAEEPSPEPAEGEDSEEPWPEPAAFEGG